MSNKDILLVKKKMSVELEPKKLYVKNIDRSVSDDQLKDYFSQFGEVVFARIPRKFGKSRGFGFVEFATEEAAKTAVEQAQDKPITGFEREIKVDFCEKRERSENHDGNRGDYSSRGDHSEG